MATWYSLKEVKDETSGTSTAILDLFDEIGGWGIQASEVIAKLRELGDNGDLIVNINSPGGSIIAGNAIFNALLLCKRNKIANIDFAASMASVIAMACDEIQMAENGWLMIHKPWTITMGDADELRKDADVLDKMQKNIVHAYMRQTELSESEVNALMDAETWMDAQDAFEMGFIDRISHTSEQAAASLTRHADALAKFQARPAVKPAATPAPDVVAPSGPITPSVNALPATSTTITTGTDNTGTALPVVTTGTLSAPDPAADLKARTDAAYEEGFAAGFAAGKAVGATAAKEHSAVVEAELRTANDKLAALDKAHEAEIKALGTRLADEHRAAMEAQKAEADKKLKAEQDAGTAKDKELTMLRATVVSLSPGFLAPVPAPEPPTGWEQAISQTMKSAKMTYEEARAKAEKDFPELFKQFHHDNKPPKE